jgi:hypothetical protein
MEFSLCQELMRVRRSGPAIRCGTNEPEGRMTFPSVLRLQIPARISAETSGQCAMKCAGSLQYEHDMGRGKQGGESGREAAGDSCGCEETRRTNSLTATTSAASDGSAGSSGDDSVGDGRGDRGVDEATRTKSTASRRSFSGYGSSGCTSGNLMDRRSCASCQMCEGSARMNIRLCSCVESRS